MACSQLTTHACCTFLYSWSQVRAVIPRRNDLPGDRGVLIIAYASHKKKAYSFFLVQSEYGDIYKVSRHIAAAHMLKDQSCWSAP